MGTFFKGECLVITSFLIVNSHHLLILKLNISILIGISSKYM
jgi:hypothetical protein